MQRYDARVSSCTASFDPRRCVARWRRDLLSRCRRRKRCYVGLAGKCRSPDEPASGAKNPRCLKLVESIATIRRRFKDPRECPFAFFPGSDSKEFYLEFFLKFTCAFRANRPENRPLPSKARRFSIKLRFGPKRAKPPDSPLLPEITTISRRVIS